MTKEEVINNLEKMKELSTMIVPQKKEVFDVSTAIAIESVKRIVWRAKDDK